MVIKCKMCGAPCTIKDENAKIFTCEYCNSQQTVVNLDDERKVNLNERANQYRRNGEFDKAQELFEKVLSYDNTDPDVYWNIVLCKYGVTYVKDPSSGEQIPTINRTQKVSVLSDENYKKALEYSDDIADEILEKQARKIDEINRQILALSEKEEPYDVFISYKETETGTNNKRTKDSILANQIYDQLRREGFKVFFSRITLKEKAGSEFEPVIYSALKTSKVMVLVSTSKEHMVAPWVKNEWSRFLRMSEKDKGKTIIPVYKDMDPYEDFPDELALYQGLDLADLSTIPELILTIRKKLELEKGKDKKAASSFELDENYVVNIKALFRRVEIFLSDDDFDSADQYCEKILDINPECFDAYVGKLMIEYRIKDKEELGKQNIDFSQSKNYKKAMLFANDEQREWLNSKVEEVIGSIKAAKKNQYLNACDDNLNKIRYKRQHEQKINVATYDRKIESYQAAKKRVSSKINYAVTSNAGVKESIAVLAMIPIQIICFIMFLLNVDFIVHVWVNAICIILMIGTWVAQLVLNVCITIAIDKCKIFFAWILGPLSFFIPIICFLERNNRKQSIFILRSKLSAIDKDIEKVKAQKDDFNTTLIDYTNDGWINDDILSSACDAARDETGYEDGTIDDFKEYLSNRASE